MNLVEFLFGTFGEITLLSIAILFLRIFTGALFFVHGIPKLFFKEARKQMRDNFKQIGIPGPLFDAVGLLEVIGGIALIFGFLTRIAAGLFFLEMIGTTLLYIKLIKIPIPRGYIEPMFKATKGYIGGWELDTVLFASSLAIALIGPGIFSIDHLVLNLLE